MARLRAPIKQLLDERLPELAVQRIWRELQPALQRRGMRGRLPLWAAAAVALLGLAGWAGLRAFDRGSEAGSLAVRGAVADTLAPASVLGGATESVWPLSDGSQITLAGASALEVVANTHGAFVARLERGRGRFDVRPGGPRRWRIECDELSVEVVGTSFSVARSERAVSVAVNHGVVLVRGPRVAGGTQLLHAGQRLELARQQPAAAARPIDLQPMAAGAPAPEPPKAAPNAVAPPTTRPAVARTSRPAVAAGGANTDTGATRASPPSAAGVAARLLREADRARRGNRLAEAEALLERVRTEAPGSVHAALAGLTLARMRLPEAPARAAEDLAAALDAKLPAGLREDAMARLVEARARAGQADLARVAARAYQRAYPQGRRASDVQRWTPP